LTEEGVFFVTRMRTDMVYRIAEERQVPQNRNVLADQVVYLGSRNVME
ncbi:MAG: IS4 family transposase, partial [Acidobacteria bacterium]